jgi:hypothetical protein
MNDRTVLVKVAKGTQEGWQWMTLEDFLQRIDLHAWQVSDEQMIAIVLPPTRPRVLN